MVGEDQLGEGMRKLKNRFRGCHWIATAFGLAMTMLLFLPMGSQAEDCSAQMEGYCLSKIAEETVKTLSQKIEITIPQEQKGNDLIAGNDYLDFYNALWDKLIASGHATVGGKEKAFETAARAGGIKIGGINLVVLAAQTLEQLSNKKIISMDKAQEILDNAKIK